MSPATTLAEPAQQVLPHGPCGGLPPLEVSWRFGTGARPVASASVAGDGSVYVGTSEGYVHALREDGSYLWSYTLQGPVSGRSALSLFGALLVPSGRSIYALRPNGTLLWAFQSPLRVLGDLARDGRGRFHFASHDGRLFALSSAGELITHVPGRVAFSALQVELPDGAIAAGRRNGEVLLVPTSGRTTRFALPSAPSALLGCPGARLCAIAGGTLYALVEAAGHPEHPWSTLAVRAGASAELLAVLPSDSSLEVFGGESRQRLFSRALPESASAAPVLDAQGTSYISLRTGALVAIARSGKLVGCAEVGRSALGAAVYDRERRRVLVTAAEGVLAAVAVE